MPAWYFSTGDFRTAPARRTPAPSSALIGCWRLWQPGTNSTSASLEVLTAAYIVPAGPGGQSILRRMCQHIAWPKNSRKHTNKAAKILAFTFTEACKEAQNDKLENIAVFRIVKEVAPLSASVWTKPLGSSELAGWSKASTVLTLQHYRENKDNKLCFTNWTLWRDIYYNWS